MICIKQNREKTEASLGFGMMGKPSFRELELETIPGGSE